MLNHTSAYLDLIRGYSEIKWNGQSVYVKHLTSFDHIEIDAYREAQEVEIAAKGIPTLEIKTEWLESKGLWNCKKDLELAQIRDYVANLRKTRANLITAAQAAGIDGMIAEAEVQYREMAAKKDELFGTTAETMAVQKATFFQLWMVLYKDSGLTSRLFSRAEMDAMDDEDSFGLLNAYIRSIEPFSHANIRRLAISPYFTNPFYLCGDDIGLFLGKPMSQLTAWQVDLLSSGVYFKRLMSQNPIPDEIADDPDKIEETVQRATKMKEIAGQGSIKGGSMGIMGATSKDFKAAGIKENREGAMSLDKMAQS